MGNTADILIRDNIVLCFISMTNMKISAKWKQIMTLLVHAVSEPQFFKVEATNGLHHIFRTVSFQLD